MYLLVWCVRSLVVLVLIFIFSDGRVRNYLIFQVKICIDRKCPFRYVAGRPKVIPKTLVTLRFAGITLGRPCRFAGTDCKGDSGRKPVTIETTLANPYPWVPCVNLA